MDEGKVVRSIKVLCNKEDIKAELIYTALNVKTV